MTWPKSTHFGYGRDARAAGKKGGKNSPHPKYRSAEWLNGYKAGWRASERWFADQWRTRRGKHSNVA